jgi:hypothetical protein
MATNERSKVIQHLRRVALRKDGAGLTDAQLLQEYLSRQEEAALGSFGTPAWADDLGSVPARPP